MLRLLPSSYQIQAWLAGGRRLVSGFKAEAKETKGKEKQG